MSKRKTTEEFKCDVAKKHPTISVTGTYINDKTPIDLLCNICGTEWKDIPHYVLHTSLGCPECNQKYVHVGENDFATMAPHLLCFFKDPKYATKITYMSHKLVDLVCPICGAERTMNAFDLYREGFHCQCCDDGVSYPNRIIRNVMRTFNIEDIKFEYCNTWTNGRFYDVYFSLNGQRYVIEMDGSQHKVGWKNSAWPSTEEIMKIDKEKNQLAFDNGVQMIRIDCRQSRFSYIRKNIENSILSNIFDLSLVDWVDCDRKSQKSLIYEICETYNQNPTIELSDIANYFGISVATVRTYLHKGAELDICCYKKKKNRKAIPIKAIATGSKKQYDFNSIRQCRNFLSKYIKEQYTQNKIQIACETGTPYKGFYFEYA